MAGYTVGPVWFTRRPDPSFHQFMSQYMDKQVEGALGGSALKFFRVTVDYPNAVAALRAAVGEISTLGVPDNRPNGPGEFSPGLRPQADTLGGGANPPHAACKAARARAAIDPEILATLQAA